MAGVAAAAAPRRCVSTTATGEGRRWLQAVGTVPALRPVTAAAATDNGLCAGLQVVRAAAAVQTVSLSPAGEYPSTSGMWAVPAAVGHKQDALLVWSFLTGSRALAAGTSFHDVTELVGLEAGEPTVACGLAGDYAMAQVTPSCVVLCGLHGVAEWIAQDAAAAASGEELADSDSGSGGRSAAAGGSGVRRVSSRTAMNRSGSLTGASGGGPGPATGAWGIATAAAGPTAPDVEGEEDGMEVDGTPPLRASPASHALMVTPSSSGSSERSFDDGGSEATGSQQLDAALQARCVIQESSSPPQAPIGGGSGRENAVPPETASPRCPTCGDSCPTCGNGTVSERWYVADCGGLGGSNSSAGGNAPAGDPGSILVASVAPGCVVLALSHRRDLQVLTVSASCPDASRHHAGGARCGTLAGRKRTRHAWRLCLAGAIPQAAEVSCLHLSRHPGGQASSRASCGRTAGLSAAAGGGTDAMVGRYVLLVGSHSPGVCLMDLQVMESGDVRACPLVFLGAPGPNGLTPSHSGRRSGADPAGVPEALLLLLQPPPHAPGGASASGRAGPGCSGTGRSAAGASSSSFSHPAALHWLTSYRHGGVGLYRYLLPPQSKLAGRQAEPAGHGELLWFVQLGSVPISLALLPGRDDRHQQVVAVGSGAAYVVDVPLTRPRLRWHALALPEGVAHVTAVRLAPCAPTASAGDPDTSSRGAAAATAAVANDPDVLLAVAHQDSSWRLVTLAGAAGGTGSSQLFPTEVAGPIREAFAAPASAAAAATPASQPAVAWGFNSRRPLQLLAHTQSGTLLMVRSEEDAAATTTAGAAPPADVDEVRRRGVGAAAAAAAAAAAMAAATAVENARDRKDGGASRRLQCVDPDTGTLLASWPPAPRSSARAPRPPPPAVTCAALWAAGLDPPQPSSSSGSSSSSAAQQRMARMMHRGAEWTAPRGVSKNSLAAVAAANAAAARPPTRGLYNGSADEPAAAAELGACASLEAALQSSVPPVIVEEQLILVGASAWPSASTLDFSNKPVGLVSVLRLRHAVPPAVSPTGLPLPVPAAFAAAAAAAEDEASGNAGCSGRDSGSWEFEVVASLGLPAPVACLCAFGRRTFLLAVGNRLACYSLTVRATAPVSTPRLPSSPRQQPAVLSRQAAIYTRSPVTALSTCGDRRLAVTADAMGTVSLYRYRYDEAAVAAAAAAVAEGATPFLLQPVAFLALAADPILRPISDILLLPGTLSGLAAGLAGSACASTGSVAPGGRRDGWDGREGQVGQDARIAVLDEGGHFTVLTVASPSGVSPVRNLEAIAMFRCATAGSGGAGGERCATRMRLAPSGDSPVEGLGWPWTPLAVAPGVCSALAASAALRLGAPSALSPCLYLGGPSGSLACLLPCAPAGRALLQLLQAALVRRQQRGEAPSALVVMGATHHARQRGVLQLHQLQRRFAPESRGVLDGDLLEAFLDLSPMLQRAVVATIPAAALEAQLAALHLASLPDLTAAGTAALLQLVQGAVTLPGHRWGQDA